jgi:inner membrane protein
MKQRFYVKFSIIFVLILALLIPQSFIMDLVSERTAWRQQAYQSIEQSWPGMQTLAGPVLVVPYHLTFNSKEKIIVNKVEKEVIKEITLDDVLYLMPKQLKISSQLTSETRYRGIYAVPVYSNALQVTGEFNNQAILEVISGHKDKKIRWDKPQLSVLVSDQRGIAAPPRLTWNNDALDFQPSVNLPQVSTIPQGIPEGMTAVASVPHSLAGMHAALPDIAIDKPSTLAFAFNLELRGMRAMNFALLSENTQVKLAANWANPSFMGELLPEKRDITEQGFTAEWRASSFSYNVSSALEQCRKGDCNSLLQRAVGFELIQPVDVYQQSERSIKYAELFIILTFMALVLFELLKKCRIHPIQYTLVGMALLVFYLLLISLSEHILFLYAYGIGALASIALLTFYFGAILHSRKLGLILGAALATLYGLLYMILQSEENALLMGSVLIFVMLAALMMATRHFDWYALTAQDDKPSA